MAAGAQQRQRLNVNGGWLMHVGDADGAALASFDDGSWQRVTLPRAWNEDDAYSKFIHEHRDTVVWYRKHFSVGDIARRRFFIEFEGVRQAADV